MLTFIDQPGTVCGCQSRTLGRGGAGAISTRLEASRRSSCSSAVTDALALPAGGRSIDVGCGTGDDVASSAGSADGAFAVGIDNDRSVLVEATRRWTHTRAAFTVADAHHLPIVSGCMHGCRSERTLQHVGDPAAVVAELARVLRPGGRLALTEPDWETCVVGGLRLVSLGP
jgi:ubiquinone/menaquinone biosynthesis C-methylase UbiE